MSFYVLLMGGSTPIGSFLLGQAAAHLGVGTAVWLFGATCVLSVSGVAIVRRSAMTPRPMEEPASPVEPPGTPETSATEPRATTPWRDGEPGLIPGSGLPTATNREATDGRKDRG